MINGAQLFVIKIRFFLFTSLIASLSESGRTLIKLRKSVNFNVAFAGRIKSFLGYEK